MADRGSFVDVTGLHNRYFAVRHGESESNVQKIIVSTPDIGSHSYGLTDLGKEQAQKACEKLQIILSSSCSNAIMISSCFKRARQTAETIHSVLKCTTPLQIDEALNERYWGDYDLKDVSLGYKHYKEDAQDVANTQHGIESVTNILLRTSGLVKQLEQTHTNKDIILVSHGDPLRILLAGFAKVDLTQNDLIPHFGNAEVRELTDSIVLQNCIKLIESV